jgi:hypothetical protein
LRNFHVYADEFDPTHEIKDTWKRKVKKNKKKKSAEKHLPSIFIRIRRARPKTN